MPNGRYDACSCGLDGVVVRPKRVHKEEIQIFEKGFACPRNHGDSRKEFQVAEPVTLEPLRCHIGGQFVPTLMALWGQIGFGISMGSLWCHSGFMKVRFQKTFVFPIRFNDFIQRCDELGSIWDCFGIGFGI